MAACRANSQIEKQTLRQPGELSIDDFTIVTGSDGILR